MTDRQIPPYSRPTNLDQLGRANARAIRRAQRRVLRAFSMLTTPVAVGFPPPLRAGSRELRALNEVALALDIYAAEAEYGPDGRRVAEAMILDALCDGPGSAPETVRLPSRPPLAPPLDRAQPEIPVPAAVQLAPPGAPPEVEPYRDSELPTRTAQPIDPAAYDAQHGAGSYADLQRFTAAREGPPEALAAQDAAAERKLAEELSASTPEEDPAFNTESIGGCDGPTSSEPESPPPVELFADDPRDDD